MASELASPLRTGHFKELLHFLSCDSIHYYCSGNQYFWSQSPDSYSA